MTTPSHDTLDSKIEPLNIGDLIYSVWKAVYDNSSESFTNIERDTCNNEGILTILSAGTKPVSMPGCGKSSASNGSGSPKPVTTARGTISRKNEAGQGSLVGVSVQDRAKMSEYVSFVDSQAQECLKRLREEIERDSQSA